MVTRTSRSRGIPKRTAHRSTANASRVPWMLLAAAAGLVLVAAAAVAIVVSGSSGPSEPAQQPLAISGEPLPQLPLQGSDPGIGHTVPTLSGEGLDGEPMQIGPNQGATLVVVFAHWCPVCQAEVPRLVDMIDSGQVPDGVSVVGLSTHIDPLRANYPPSDWLEREGWHQPTLVDDAASSGRDALGISRYPGFVLVNGQGQVVQRMLGAVDPQQLVQAMELAAAQ